MSKVVEDSPEDVLDIVLEYVIVILIGIPIGLILLAVVLVCCLICLPFYVPMAPYLIFSYRRRSRVMNHPLSDWTLGVVETITPPIIISAQSVSPAGVPPCAKGPLLGS